MIKTMPAVVFLSFPVLAGPVIVEDFSRYAFSNGTDVIQTDAVWVDSDAALEKTGAGKWTLPLGLVVPAVDIAVRSGTIAVPSAAGEMPDPEKPVDVMNRAALWLDATRNVDATNGTGNAVFLKDWRDVRETSSSLPYVYAHAVPRWLDPSSDGTSGTLKLPEVRERVPGVTNVYFHGYRSGACLRIAAPDSTDMHSIADVRHVFVVHGVFETQGFVISTENGTRLYHPGTTAGLPTDTLLTPNGNNVPFLPNIGVWLNGEKTDPNLTVPANGYQLLQLDYVSPLADTPATVNAFYNDYNITPSRTSGEPAHIGGDDLCEVLVFTNTLARADCVKISRYLLHKWGLGGETPRHVLTLAQDASVELENPSDASDGGRVSLAGKGTVSCPGDGALARYGHRNPDFSGSVSIADGQSAVFGDDVYAVKARDGMSLTAVNSYEGLLVSAESAGTGDITVSANESELVFKEIPESTKRLTVTSGTLRISPDVTEGPVRKGTVSSVVIPNGGFEAAGHAGAGWSTDRGAWIWEGNGGWCMAWSRDLYGQYNPEGKITWISPFSAPEGDYVAAINGAGSLYSTVSVTEPGVYELSFFIHDSARSRQKVANKFQQSLQVIVADADGSDERFLGYAVGAYELGYVRVRYRTPELPAGDYRIVFRSPERSSSTDVTATVDDVRMQLVSREDGTVPVPNGDFERVSLPDGLLVYTISGSNTAEGWTFGQSDWGSSVDGEQGVAVVRYAMRYSASDSKRAFPAKVQDFRTGMHQLAMISDCGFARTVFSPSVTGTFRLRAAVSRYRMKVNGKNFYSTVSGIPADPRIEAKITIGGETVSLGCVTGACQRLTEMTWPVAFDVTSAEDAVTLTISNQVSNAAAIVDDFVLVPAEHPESRSELVENGVLTKGAGGWTVVKRSGDAYSGSENQLQFGYSRCYDGQDEPWGMVLVDRAGMYQDVTFPRPGRYRLRYHTRGRVDYYEEQCGRDAFRYSRDVSARAVLVRGGITNVLSVCNATLSNFVARTVYIDVSSAPETCVLGFETTNDPDVSGNKGRSVFIDGVSLAYCGAAETAEAPELPENLTVEVEQGARLALDFTGTVTVGKVRVGGRSRSGIINAARFPGYFSGTGSLEVVPKPTVIVIR